MTESQFTVSSVGVPNGSGCPMGNAPIQEDEAEPQASGLEVRVTLPRRPSQVALPARMKHLPRDERGYPVLATINQPTGAPKFKQLSESRKLVLAAYDFCGVCGQPFDADDLRWQVVFPGMFGFDDVDKFEAERKLIGFNEVPVHQICGLYSAVVCPFVASPDARMGDGSRQGVRRGDIVALLGYRETRDVFVAGSGVQQGTSILHFRMSNLVNKVVLKEPAETWAAYQEALRTERPVSHDKVTQSLVNQLATPALRLVESGDGDAGAFMAAAVVMAGGVFLDGVENLDGLDQMVSDDIRVIAAHIAHDTGRVPKNAYDDHAYLGAARRWVADRHESKALPTVFKRWHARARAKVPLAYLTGGAATLGAKNSTAGPVPPAGRKAKSGSQKAKAQRAARRKNRR